MPYPNNYLIQKAMVSKLRANATLVAELASASEIKEDQWQGTAFVYPAVRVQLRKNTPRSDNDNCSTAMLELAIQVFTEDDSSLNCDRIAGIIHTVLHANQFTSESINISLKTTNLRPAFRRSEENKWIAEVQMTGSASG